MHVLFVTSEFAPLYKLGGLADVSFSLPKALNRHNVHTCVILPYYRDIHLSRYRCIGSLAVDYDGQRQYVFLFSTTIEGVPVLLLRHEKILEYHKKPITDTFSFFCQAVIAFTRSSQRILGYDFDVVHCNDWHTGLVPVLMGESYKLTSSVESLQAKQGKTIMTIHNMLYHGDGDGHIPQKLGLPRALFHIKEKESVSFLREGLEYVDMITTVSPTYAREIQTRAYGGGLAHVFARRKDVVVGILNGIDEESWDPTRDGSIGAMYSRQCATAGKQKNKAHLQRFLRLPRVDVPVFGFIGRLESLQKGIDILLDAFDILFDEKKSLWQCVILGNGNDGVAKRVEALVGKHPKELAFVHAFDETVARSIYAGSDMIVVPSKFEPCGLVQMIAMRYGAIPIVRKTGGLVDSVTDRKTGFVFGAYTARALARAMTGAISAMIDRTTWRRLVDTAMRQDFSWRKSAKKYVALYESLAKA